MDLNLISLITFTFASFTIKSLGGCNIAQRDDHGWTETDNLIDFWDIETKEVWKTGEKLIFVSFSLYI